jgi:hypothetical protein
VEMTENETFHGGAPRVRREENEDIQQEKIVIDMEQVASSAIDAGTAAMVSVIVSRAVK